MQIGKKFIRAGMIAASLGSLVSAGNAGAAQSQLFTATITTMEQLIPGNPLCAGQPAGVGAGTGTSDLFVKKTNGAPAPIGMASTDCVQTSGDLPPTTLTFQKGFFIITGPGGDSIMATYNGTLAVSPTPVIVNGQPLPSYTFNKGTQFIISGGTGRFARASGSGMISGTEVVNFVNGTSQGQLNASGTINY